MPAALALASSVSNSVKENVPASGSIVPQGMSSSAVVRPSARSPAKNDSDQAVPLLSKSSWVDQIGVVGDEAADVFDVIAIRVVLSAAACEPLASETAIRLPATMTGAAIAA